MDIDERDIKKGSLPDILPEFHPNSVSYLSELNYYRMYAEVWSNKRRKANARRAEIGHARYLKTLEFGERKKKRKSDKIRFDYFIVANSLNYKLVKNIYGERSACIHIRGAQTNTIFSNIMKPETSSKTQSMSSDGDFHANGYLSETLKFELDKMELYQDAKSNKHYFEISTNVPSIPNQNQKELLLRILGKEDIFEKLHLLYKVGRKYIRCLFENPEIVIKDIGKSNALPRLCVAWPFHETLVFDFAGTPEEYGDACLLGTLIKAEGTIDKVQKDTSWLDGSQIDSYA